MSEKMIKRTDEIIAELVREKVEFQKAYNYYAGKRDEEQFKYLEENFNSPTLTNKILADKCKISEVYFRKLFKKLNGVSPQKYIINLKLEFAFHLLGSNLYSVSEVSQKSGFQDTKYFSRIFKKRYGYSPKDVQSKSELFNLRQK